jgi:ABC-type nitrate/sulfonate/bicarbonate transport system substrate-binding protein
LQRIQSFWRAALPRLCALCVLCGLHSSVDAADRIRIAVSNPNMPNHTVTVAQKKDFFKNENIDAEIIRMNPNVAITALATGERFCRFFHARNKSLRSSQ